MALSRLGSGRDGRFVLGMLVLCRSLLLSTSPALPPTFLGEVVGIQEGGTSTLLTSKYR
ncbi:hypothetical protein [Pseudoroseomonas ludipueritiae]|uniref:Uncharacterized protein n=1 Tax=Pseudoroseomonas ludipueritiae TaxID=198093 RepID=A0ABR7R7I4_9PROT|nr:hypothetical protein [Pseudoroseomonas ludipueritiae]MBC9177730.1 hypothetical protein [Pseudoroseomonas ludipueritiae]MCG7360590.1 hypothetical protein [Roseomonas sp. ACRSG]